MALTTAPERYQDTAFYTRLPYPYPDTNVNNQVGEIATQVGTSPASWNAGVFSLILQLSETVVLPVAGRPLRI